MDFEELFVNMEYLETIPGPVYMIVANGAHCRNHDHGSLGQHFINKNQQLLVYSERYKKHTSSLCLSVDSHQFTVAYPGIGWGGGGPKCRYFRDIIKVFVFNRNLSKIIC